MKNFTDYLFEDLIDDSIIDFSDVPGATKLLSDAVSRLSLVLYNNFNLHISPKEGQIIDNTWEYELVFNNCADLNSFLDFLRATNEELTDYYKKHKDTCHIRPVPGAQPDKTGIYTDWYLVENASEKAKKQFNNVLRFIELKNNYLKNLLKKLENDDKVSIEFSTSTPTTYTNSGFNLSVVIKIDLAAFDPAIDISVDLAGIDSTEKILSYFMEMQGRWFSTKGILTYINSFINHKYGYFKNGVSAFQYLINAGNQELLLSAYNPDTIKAYREGTQGKILPTKLVTSDPDLKLILKDAAGNIQEYSADAKIYFSDNTSSSKLEKSHTSDYLLAAFQQNPTGWRIGYKEDSYSWKKLSEFPIFKINNIELPNLTLLKFVFFSNGFVQKIQADQTTDKDLPKYLKVQFETLIIDEK